MIRLTLRDGERVQIPAVDVIDVEPVAGGAVVHRTSGETLAVVQDVRTIELRVKVAMAAKANAESATPVERMPARRSFSARAKRVLRGRSSLKALIFWRRR